MRGRRVLASILVVALGGVSLGVATAWYSDSATIKYQISAASDFGDEPEEKVWVCKLVGSPADPEVKKGKNPIQVSVNSIDAQEGFSDAHPSYVVESGDVECALPTEGIAAVGDNERAGASEADTTTTSTTSSTTSTSTSTTTTSTSTTSSTSSTTTTTTSSSTTTSSTTTTSTTTTTTLTPDH